jgi:lipopolysaccharide export system permease protein
LALRTLDRYIFREVAVTWVAVSGVLLIILVSLQLARVLAQAAANNFPSDIVLTLIGLTSTAYLTLVVPIGLFLAIMLGLGRLYHESEMAAIQSCGVGPGGLYRPVAVLGVLIAGLLAWLSFWAVPQAAARAAEIRAEAARDAQFGLLEPGRFRTIGSGNVVFYAERVDENGVLYNVNVFVDHSSDDEEERKLEIWRATRAEQRGAGRADQLFVLYDGERYEGIPGSAEFRIMRFSEGGYPIRLGALDGGARKPATRPTAELLNSNDAADRAELEWRLSNPVMALILMIMAVPLARLRPRQGRFGKIGIAILAYFLYQLALDAARTWLEEGLVPPQIGVWWVHGLALCLAAWLLVRENPPVKAQPVAASA